MQVSFLIGLLHLRQIMVDAIRPRCYATTHSDTGPLYGLRHTREDSEADVKHVGGTARVVVLYDQAALDAALSLWPRDCRPAGACPWCSALTAISTRPLRRASIGLAAHASAVARSAMAT